ncbi:transmembrane amino acid transporter protein-domain-containing protein [Pelagophyceae sp. CCMP2097]|nr:transmembrane amino acid transporter protein-domain-containing protein [Pelagophyceae sp. CCMP2097]
MAPAGAAGADRRTAVVYLVKAFVGPGCLALPLAFRHAGLGLGAVLLLCLSAAVRHNMHSLVACKRHAGAATYPDLARRALGHKWRAAAEALVNVVQLGICAVYFDFFAETTLALLPAAVRPGGAAAPRLFMVAVAPCYAALALLRSVEAIAPYAALANALVFCAIAVVLFAAAARVGRAAQAGDFAAAERWARPGRAPLFYATVVYSFEGICSLLPLENALAEPADMRFVIDAGLAARRFVGFHRRRTAAARGLAGGGRGGARRQRRDARRRHAHVPRAAPPRA